MIGLAFSLTFMMINLMIQALVWSVRLSIWMVKLTFELIETLAGMARH